MIADHNEGKIRLCFGSKKLFHAQFNLDANGFKSHQEWYSHWEQERNNSFFLLGSKDETSGNQSCSAIVEGNHLNLRIRLPDILGQHEKYLTIRNIHFKYGSEAIFAALRDCEERNRLLKAKDPRYRDFGQAISYRFKKDEKGWRLFASTSLAEPVWVSRQDVGAIGVDINANHLAAVESDRYGNPIKSKIIPLDCYGKNSEQAKALIGDAVAELVQWGVLTQKPLVVEKLDFQKKKIK